MKNVLVLGAIGGVIAGVVLANRKAVTLTGDFTFWTPELTTEFGVAGSLSHVIFDGASTMNELHVRFHGVIHANKPTDVNFHIYVLVNGVIVRKSNSLGFPNMTHAVLNDSDGSAIVYSTDPIGAITAEAVIFNGQGDILASVKSRQIAEVL